MNSPCVYLVGAGPGDPELLTRKAYRLITEADVVVYDNLVPQSIIDLIPQGTDCVYAGKSCKKHHLTQDEIHAVLLEKSKRAKCIVRLKGGDPFIFGRGGEEMLFLEEHGIEYEVVPGVTSASAASAIAGIPLTHRGVVGSVCFMTGHAQKGKPVEHFWEHYVASDATLVIYMGLANLESITENLIKAGMEPTMPAAIIQGASTDNERVMKGTVTNIASLAREHAFAAPTLVIIGKVVALSPGGDTF